MYVSTPQFVQPTKTATHDNGHTHTFVRMGAPSMTILFNTETIIRAPGPGGVGASTTRPADWTSFLMTWSRVVTLLPRIRRQ